MNAKIKQALKTARTPWGIGWTSLTAEHRNALVVASLIGQFTAMDCEPLSTERRSELLTDWQALMSEAMRTEF